MIAAILLSLSLQAADPQDTDPQDEADQLEDVRAEQEAAREREAELREQAEQAAAEAEDLQGRVVELADEAAATEQRALALELRLPELAAEEKELSEKLTAERETLMKVLAALQRAEMRRPPPLAVSADDAASAARSGIMLSAVAPELEKRADAVRARIEELARVREQIAADRKALAEEEAALEQQRAELDAALAEREAMRERLSGEAREQAETAEELAGEAQNLEALIAEIRRRAEEQRLAEERRRAEEARRLAETRAGAEAARREAEQQAAAQEDVPDARITSGAAPEPAPTPPAREITPPAQETAPPPRQVASEPAPAIDNAPLPTDFADARGALRAPAAGAMIKAFGSAEPGGAAQGMTLATRSAAQVVAPFEGRVEFAGPFPGYGEMLILSVGGGYHIILSGMARLNVSSGQRVLAGEPVGEMTDRSQPPPELYYEIRKNGSPIDPAPWTRAGVQAG